MEFEVLKMEERIQIALETGESHYREFKSAFEGKESSKKPRQVKNICKDIAGTLVAFANAEGGELIIGIEDDSTVTGILHSDEDIEKMIGSIKTHIHHDTPLHQVKSLKVNFRDKKLLYFQTTKSTEQIHCTTDGKCLIRNDRESVPRPPKHIVFQRHEKQSRQFDRLFIDGATISDLDIGLLEVFADDIFKGLSIEKFLQIMGLAEYTPNGLKIRNAALLLFAKEISRWHPRSQVRFVKVLGNKLKSGDEYNASEVDLVEGNVFKQINETWEKLRPFLVIEDKLSSGAIFERKFMYPEFACREAIINAIAHRDYSIEGRSIEIFIYNDRLEIKSPGELLSTITVESIKKLKGVHESRNSLIARVLREKGFMQELGEGMRRIYDLFRKNELSPPEILSANESFILTLQHKSVYKKEHKLWLEEFKNKNLIFQEKTIVLLGYNNNVFSTEDIWNNVGIIDTEDYRKLVKSLQDKGILLCKYGNRVKAFNIAKKQKIPLRKLKRWNIINPREKPEKFEKKQLEFVSDYETDYEETRVYVVNLPYEIQTNELFDIFGSVGDIIDIYVPISNETNMPRGYAFIAFENREEAQKAIMKFNFSFIKGRKISVSLAHKKKLKTSKSNKMF